MYSIQTVREAQYNIHHCFHQSPLYSSTPRTLVIRLSTCVYPTAPVLLHTLFHDFPSLFILIFLCLCHVLLLCLTSISSSSFIFVFLLLSHLRSFVPTVISARWFMYYCSYEKLLLSFSQTFLFSFVKYASFYSWTVPSLYCQIFISKKTSMTSLWISGFRPYTIWISFLKVHCVLYHFILFLLLTCSFVVLPAYSLRNGPVFSRNLHRVFSFRCWNLCLFSWIIC